MVPNVLVNPRRNPAYLQERGDNIYLKYKDSERVSYQLEMYD